MKVTAFNGSPRGEAGNTNVMVVSFLDGAAVAGAEVESVLLADKRIDHCTACLSCVNSGQKQCVIDDDMGDLVSKFLGSDIIVLATPLYIYNISGMMKVFLDRLFCIGNAFYDSEQDENGEHRHSQSKHFKNGLPPKFVLISNSGMPYRSRFQAVSLWAKLFAWEFHMELLAEIYAPEGVLLTASIKELEPVISGYQELLKKAGQEIVTNLKLSGETRDRLENNFVPADSYIQEMNKHWAGV